MRKLEAANRDKDEASARLRLRMESLMSDLGISSRDSMASAQVGGAALEVHRQQAALEARAAAAAALAPAAAKGLTPEPKRPAAAKQEEEIVVSLLDSDEDEEAPPPPVSAPTGADFPCLLSRAACER